MATKVLVTMGCLLVPTIASDTWKFLGQYPKHQVVEMLADGQTIHVDGILDEHAWARTNWTEYQWVDITRHNDSSLNRVFPPFNLLRLKTLWSEHTLYMAAQLREPFVYGTVVGHNTPTPPYKEFEMNANNATYDVMWGVPDGAGLKCSHSGHHPYLPTCVNTSFPGYAGSWTMAGEPGGLRTSTSFDTKKYGRYNTDSASALWSTEIAFPIRPNGSAHGGLLDAGSEAESERYRSQFDPGAAVAKGKRLYWYCPPNCSDALVDAVPSLANPNKSQCAEVLRSSPTLLGVMPWNCYYEWVWRDVGADNYMHRPLHWGVLEFRGAPTNNITKPPCLNIQWPGRLVATQIFYAQAQHKYKTGTYADNMSTLVTSCTPPRCEPSVLATALARPQVFGFNLRVQSNPRVLDSSCSARPCFTATVRVSAPLGLAGETEAEGEYLDSRETVFVYNVSVDQNMRMLTDAERDEIVWPCL